MFVCVWVYVCLFVCYKKSNLTTCCKGAQTGPKDNPCKGIATTSIFSRAALLFNWKYFWG